MCQEGDRQHETDIVSVDVHQRILAGNDATARHNREHFRKAAVLAVNIMGSPGAGKTAMLEATARALGATRRIGALAGDLETDRDAERLRGAGIAARSINTGSACHLDARMVHHGLHELTWQGCDYLFIENVGNLVCPAVYDLGQAFNVVTLAVTEGEDKPLKYPVMFQRADLVLLTKVDLLPYLDVNVDVIARALARVMPAPVMIPMSAKTGEGIHRWVRWLERKKAEVDAFSQRYSVAGSTGRSEAGAVAGD
jgi:hydrogenase nickel incorporation protein HypB